MQENNSNWVWWVIGIIVVLLIIWALWSYSGTSTPSSTATTTAATDATAAAQVVTSFGAELQNVSVQSSTASTSIADDYATFVDPTLLASWEANPASAPGRTVSSPWPDHIDIANTAPDGSGGYTVTGDIALMSSAGSAGTVPFSADVSQENGAWYITSFAESPSTTTNSY